jgi:hypothetical protein
MKRDCVSLNLLRKASIEDVLKAKNIDGKHFDLEKGIGIEDNKVFIKILKEGVIESIQGCWGYDVDSAEFVESLRKSKRLNWI